MPVPSDADSTANAAEDASAEDRADRSDDEDVETAAFVRPAC
jgi:hypothetical protein